MHHIPGSVTGESLQMNIVARLSNTTSALPVAVIHIALTPLLGASSYFALSETFNRPICKIESFFQLISQAVSFFTIGKSVPVAYCLFGRKSSRRSAYQRPGDVEPKPIRDRWPKYDAASKRKRSGWRS